MGFNSGFKGLIRNDGYTNGKKNVQPNIQRGKSNIAVQEKNV